MSFFSKCDYRYRIGNCQYGVWRGVESIQTLSGTAITEDCNGGVWNNYTQHLCSVAPSKQITFDHPFKYPPAVTVTITRPWTHLSPCAVLDGWNFEFGWSQDVIYAYADAVDTNGFYAKGGMSTVSGSPCGSYIDNNGLMPVRVLWVAIGVKA